MPYQTFHPASGASSQAGQPPAAVERGLEELTDLLRRTRQMRLELADELDGSGTVELQLLALWICRDRSGPGASAASTPQHELAEALALSPAQTSNTLELLRRKGWLESYRPSDDRRRQLWRLTAVGASQLARWLSGLETWAARWIESPLPPAVERTELKLFSGDQSPSPADSSQQMGGEAC